MSKKRWRRGGRIGCCSGEAPPRCRRVACRLVLYGGMVDEMMGRIMGGMVSEMAGGMVGGMVGGMIGGMVGRMVNGMVGGMGGETMDIKIMR